MSGSMPEPSSYRRVPVRDRLCACPRTSAVVHASRGDSPAARVAVRCRTSRTWSWWRGLQGAQVDT